MKLRGNTNLKKNVQTELAKDSEQLSSGKPIVEQITSKKPFILRGSLPPGTTKPPTIDEVMRTENPHTLMQLQWLKCVGNFDHALAFLDTGSNVNLVRKEFAWQAGWEGLAVVQQLQTTGRGEEAWHTTAYWVTLVDRQEKEHNVLFFEN